MYTLKFVNVFLRSKCWVYGIYKPLKETHNLQYWLQPTVLYTAHKNVGQMRLQRKACVIGCLSNIYVIFDILSPVSGTLSGSGSGCLFWDFPGALLYREGSDEQFNMTLCGMTCPNMFTFHFPWTTKFGDSGMFIEHIQLLLYDGAYKLL